MPPSINYVSFDDEYNTPGKKLRLNTKSSRMNPLLQTHQPTPKSQGRVSTGRKPSLGIMNALNLRDKEIVKIQQNISK